MSGNPFSLYTNAYRAKLPEGVTFSSLLANYFYNRQRFNDINSVESYRKYLYSTTGFGFNPTYLFMGGEVGTWFDPSDLTTLFQDSAGTTPVTAPNQPVGLMLDKSKGSTFGADIIFNGDFSQGSTGWLVGAGVTISGGVANFVAGSGFLQQLVTTEAGRAYKVTATATINSIFCGTWDSVNQQSMLPLLSGGNSAAARSGTFSYIFVAADTTSYIAFATGGAGASTIDNVSVIPLPLGNHATQATAASRPTYGIHPITGVRNFAKGSADPANGAFWAGNTLFSGVQYTKIASGIGTDGLPFVDYTAVGTATVNHVMPLYISAQSRTPAVATQTWTASVFAQIVAGDVPTNTLTGIRLDVRGLNGAAVIQETFAVGPARPVTQTLLTNTALLTNPNTTQVQCEVGLRGETGQTVNYTVRIKALQFERSPTRTAYQANFNQFNITEAGVASVSYLGFDGIDDSMVTGTITPNIDKVQVFAGFSKSVLTNGATLVELSATSDTNNGSVGFFTDAVGGAGIYQSRFRGTILHSLNFNTTSLNRAIVNLSADLAAPTRIMRVNGSQVASSSSTMGGGNFLAYPLFIGRRGGSSLPFNGNIYSLIVRFGPNLTTGQITATEGWVNGKTGAF